MHYSTVDLSGQYNRVHDDVPAGPRVPISGRGRRLAALQRRLDLLRFRPQRFSPYSPFHTNSSIFRLFDLHFGRTLIRELYIASNIIVVGLVPHGSSPPQASYSIDGVSMAAPHLAATSQCVPNQPLFGSANGNLGAGLHNLTIDVTAASQDQPYILDYLLLCRAITDTSKSPIAETKTPSKKSKDGIIVGAVFGTVTLLLAIVFCIWLSRMRKNTEQLKSRSDGMSPYILHTS